METETAEILMETETATEIREGKKSLLYYFGSV
jgi:hypothetical protein